VDLDVVLCKDYDDRTAPEWTTLLRLFATAHGNIFLGDKLTSLTKSEIRECVLPLLEKKLPYNKRK
jgi:hypothetical protein